MQKKIPLKCPCDKKADLLTQNGDYQCSVDICIHNSQDHLFKNMQGVPVLISEANTDTVCESSSISSYVQRAPHIITKARDMLLPSNKVTTENCARFLHHTRRTSSSPKILIIGGGEAGAGTSALWGAEDAEIHSTDIYLSPTVDIVCDGHYLPLESNYYDGVWIQAVLEHVVQPQLVVSEIHRVLKNKGVVYAETPFMQQVHEGPYDFQRYTVLGHRYLFNQFEALEFGGLGGPSVVLSWAVKYLCWAIFRRKLPASIIGRALQLLLRPLDLLASPAILHDGGSGVFFLGRKKQRGTITHKELIALYGGMQKP